MTTGIYELTDTWNEGSTTFTALKLIVTDTASAADSELIHVAVAGGGSFVVDKNGNVSASGDLVQTGVSGEGLRLGTLAANDYGWRDITGDVELRGSPTTDPSWTIINAGPFYAYAFAVNDLVQLVFHVPHDIVPSSDIHLHAHWLTSGVDVNTVKWEWTYTYAKGFNQEAFSTTGTVITAEEAASGTAYQHMVTETTGITIPTLTEPDGLIVAICKRITNGGTDNADTVWLLTTDIHYQSTNQPTANKAPSFYTP